MSYIGKNPKADTLNLTPQSALPTTPSEGMLWRSDGTVRGVGLFEYKSGNWIQVDEQLGDSDTLDLQTADGCNLTYNANWYSSGSLNIQGRSDTWGAEREDLSGTGTNDFITLSTTAADLLNSNGVSVIKFAPTDATAGRNSYFGKRIDLQQGWRGSNLVVEFRYKTAEDSTGETTNEDWLFVARDASIPPLEIASQGTNTLTTSALAAVVAEDGTTSVYKAPAVGDAIMLTDTSNNTYIRYITVVTGTANAGGTPVITYSGTDLTLPTGTTVNATAMPGIFTSLTQYLPASDDQGSTYKAQVKTETDTKTIEYGIMHISTQTDQQIYVDNILLSANKFLQANSQLKSEYYQIYWQDDVWYGTGAQKRFNANVLSTAGSTSLWAAGPDTPAMGESKYLLIENSSTNVTQFKAKQDIRFSFQFAATPAAGSDIFVKNSSDQIIYRRANSNAYDNGANSFTVVLAKNDYIYFDLANLDSKYSTMNFTMTPETSPVILLESQDEIFTSWTAFTPTITGGTATEAYCLYRRVGSDMEIQGSFKIAPNGDPMTVAVPGGHSVDISKWYAGDRQIIGYMRRVYTNGYGFETGNTFDAFISADTNTTLIYHNQRASGAYFDKDVGTDCFSSGDLATFNYKVPIQGWNANFNPLLSMPLVDFSTWENTYSARIANNGTAASITSQSASFISSVSRSTTGVVSVTFTSGFFDVAPSVTATVENAANSDRYMNVYSISSTGFTCSIEAPTDFGYRDNNFNITVGRQGSDYRQPPKPTAAVIKPAVAVLGSEYAYNVAGGASGTGSTWRKRTVNTIRGESWFVTLSGTGTTGVGGTNTDFTLEAGTYKIEASFTFYQTGQSQLALYDVTNSTYPAHGIVGQNQYLYTSTGQAGNCNMMGTFTITSSTEYSIYFNCPDSGTLGNNNSFTAAVNSCYGQVRLEKLK